ncbi:outer membrane beta-barrel protein [Verrucomicrobium sp. BvORR034]|uniref:outer membrane beta-barrel protein n=1 Tax=Verrucomicrobium sp. BvORR034 TaxID=1396418 RepID=UPI000678FEA6|nr:outer membrane beta-barrel protein [Verrucomicrobium sp. BvORR034]
MKVTLALFPLTALLSLAPALQGQGLLGIGRSTDYLDEIPLTFNVGASVGYDRTEYDSMGLENEESAFIQAGVGLTYANNTAPTKWNVGVDLGTIYYLDDSVRGENYDYTARVAFNVAHQVNRRLQVSNNLYVTYETEPNYGIGVTTGRRSGQYLYGYNNTSVAYAWSERVATTTGYTIDGIIYTDDDTVADFEDRLSHLISQQVSYALNRTTKLTAEYRFRYTRFANDPATALDEEVASPDYMSHYILVGVDKAWSERSSGSFRAGVEMYQSDRSNETAPYMEGAINYALTRRSNLRWYAQMGYDASEMSLYDSRYSYRTGVVAGYQFTQSLTGNFGLHYVHSDFEGNQEIESSSEDEVNASLGFSYNFWNNLSLDANYSYTTISSDSSFREYDRHRVSVGLNAVF